MMNKSTRCDSIVILTDIQPKNIMYQSVQGNLCLSNSSFVTNIDYSNNLVHLSIFIIVIILIVHVALHGREHVRITLTTLLRVHIHD